MEQQPLPESTPDEIAAEPRLELVPSVEADSDANHLEPPAGPTQDPLKLYVRQIGDGRLLTAAEERG
jgi:hypothetical protein